jgi:hypothetical protein
MLHHKAPSVSPEQLSGGRAERSGLGSLTAQQDPGPGRSPSSDPDPGDREDETISILDAVSVVLCASKREVSQSGSAGAIAKAAVDIVAPHQTSSCRSRIAQSPSLRAQSRNSLRRPVFGAGFVPVAARH